VRCDRGRSHFWAHVGVLACVCLTAACASHRPRSLSDRFVRGATAADLKDDVDLGFPPAPESDAEADVPMLDLHPREKHSNLPTIEERDQALATALSELSATSPPASYVKAGQEYRRLGIFDSAYKNFQQALSLNPRDGAAYDQLARLWRDAGLPAIALGDAHRAVSFAPDSAAARNTLGTVLYTLGDLNGAEREFRRVLDLNPDATWAVSNLCYVAYLRGEVVRALELCEEALRATPDLTAARNNLALVHASAGRLDDAKREFIAAGGVAHGLYNTGIVHLARSDYAAAVEAFAAAVREDPKMIDAVRRAADARARAAEVRK
jgi:tetratricopeptide (TPR) repeat protein